MDYIESKRRSTSKVGDSRKGPSGPHLKDVNQEGRHAQCCNRLGCSARVYSTEGSSSFKYMESSKSFGTNSRSSSGKPTIGSSSRPFSYRTNLKKPHQGDQISSQNKERSSASSSGSPEVREMPVLTAKEMQEPASEIRDVYDTVSTAPQARNRTQKQRIEDTGSGSSSREQVSKCSLVPKSGSKATDKTPHKIHGIGSQRCGLQNLSCASISYVLPPGCSSSDPSCSRRGDVVNNSVNESTSLRGKSGGTLSIPGYRRGSSSGQTSSPIPSIRAPRRGINGSSSNRGPSVSVRTRRATTIGDSRATRLSNNYNDTPPSVVEPVTAAPTEPESSNGDSPFDSPRSLPSDPPTLCLSSYERSNYGNENGRTGRPTPYPEVGAFRGFHGLSIDRDGYHRRFNIQGVAEVLLALDRIDQDDELTYEQLLLLETNLFRGPSFHDQHRDMRLDIDNMSYEELLELEEKMGSVSTALSKDALSNCLKRSLFSSVSSVPRFTICGDVDTKCSICQEEYVDGDEVGDLNCEHRYHVGCIEEWLRLKNWCPICKAEAST
ncbi:hypothetical protein AMTRI_Chr12g274940 [Amborella trichopoda]